MDADSAQSRPDCSHRGGCPPLPPAFRIRSVRIPNGDHLKILQRTVAAMAEQVKYVILSSRESPLGL